VSYVLIQVVGRPISSLAPLAHGGEVPGMWHFRPTTTSGRAIS